MRQKYIIFICVGFALLLGLAWEVYPRLFGGTRVNMSLEKLTWKDLAQLDISSSEMPQSLAKHIGNQVLIAGFIVPLDDNAMILSDFLLVPNALACIHAPPPAMNQMILVHMTNPVENDFARRPVWVEGVIRTTSAKHGFGESSFSMDAVAIDFVRPRDLEDL
jgi:hypothetical protein